MLNFPIHDLMDFDSCYNFLSKLLHPQGLHCNCGFAVGETQKAHKYRKNGLPCYKCQKCGSVFNILRNTVLSGIHYDCIKIVLMLRGFAQGVTTQHLHEELGLSYNNLLEWRHKLQEHSFENRDVGTLADSEVESDEMFQNAGEKGDLHPNPDDPPRRRANKKRGWEHMKTTGLRSRVSLGGQANRSG